MTITITVDIDGNAVSREYAFDEYSSDVWGERVLNMLYTIEQSPLGFAEKKDDKPYPKKDGMTQVDDNIWLK